MYLAFNSDLAWPLWQVSWLSQSQNLTHPQEHGNLRSWGKGSILKWLEKEASIFGESGYKQKMWDAKRKKVAVEKLGAFFHVEHSLET